MTITRGTNDSLNFELTYYPISFGSFTLFLCIFKYVAPCLSLRISSGYSHISPAKKIEWNTRVISTVHAVIVSSVCAYTLLFDDDVYNDPIWYDSAVVRGCCAFVVGYMLADNVIMAINYRKVGEVFFFLHHGMSVCAYYYVMTYGTLPYFANYRLMAEFSTPFVNQRWFLHVLKYPKSSKVVFINGLAMTGTFFLVRIACMPLYWTRIYRVYGTPSYMKLGYIRHILIMTCVILDILNVAWFVKMCRGIMKFYRVQVPLTDRNRNLTKSQ